MRGWKKKCVFTFNADTLTHVCCWWRHKFSEWDLSPTMITSRPAERRMFDVCSLARLEAAAVQSKHWAPSHTFQFVFAALLLNNGEPMRRGGCHGEGGVIPLCAPTPHSVGVCVSNVGGGLFHKEIINKIKCVENENLALAVSIDETLTLCL